MPPTAPPPTFSTDAAHPEIYQVRQAIAAGDWSAVEALVSAVDVGTRYTIISAVAEAAAAGELCRAALEHQPADPLAGTMHAAHLIFVGGTIRSSQRAKYVSRDQFAAFHDHLRRAERLLIDITARDPGHTLGWTFRLITARGLELGQTEARRRYDRAVHATPHFLPAQTQYLQQVCPKWSGSFDKMHDFARECAGAAPLGSLNPVMIVDAHLERWLDLDDTVRTQYLTSPRVRADLRDAADRSILHPEFIRIPGWVGVMNTFAMAFSLVGDHPSAAWCFAAIGDFRTEWPWGYLGDPARSFVEHRDRALAKGGR